MKKCAFFRRVPRAMAMGTAVMLLFAACHGKGGSGLTPEDTSYVDYTVEADGDREPIIIDIEELTPPNELLWTSDYDKLLRDYHGAKEVVIAHNRYDGRLSTYGEKSFFGAMYKAYADHRPFELSPEAMWLLICQGFSCHVNNNAERLRPLFVNFEGKKTLTVYCGPDVSIDNPDSPWEKYFPQFTDQIATYTGRRLVSALGSDFTTSTPVSYTSSQITIMAAMQKYFDYDMMVTCGIPQVILHGTPEDWQSIVDRLEVLRLYELDWWVDEMIPVLEKIVKASEGEVDKDFWKGMFVSHEKHIVDCVGHPPDVDGWIIKFYPYDKRGDRNHFEKLYEAEDNLPSEILSVPMNFIDANGVKTGLVLYAGFVGISQNEKTYAVRPEIGWFITKESK